MPFFFILKNLSNKRQLFSISYWRFNFILLLINYVQPNSAVRNLIVYWTSRVRWAVSRNLKQSLVEGMITGNNWFPPTSVNISACLLRVLQIMSVLASRFRKTVKMSLSCTEVIEEGWSSDRLDFWFAELKYQHHVYTTVSFGCLKYMSSSNMCLRTPICSRFFSWL